MSETIARHWHMLRMLPRAPRKIATADLESQLRARDFGIDRRSIQRDLQKLSVFFPLECDDQHKPYGWSWARYAPAFDLPGMDRHAALAFRLADEHLAHLLPAATREFLQPYITHAREVLESTGALADWAQSVRVVQRHLPLLPPDVKPQLLATIQEALLQHQQLSLSYVRRGEDEVQTYSVNPLALVYRDAVPMLVCTLWDYEDIVQLAVHRMEDAAVLSEQRHVPRGFDVDEYIASGAFGFVLSGNPIALELLVEQVVAVTLAETPLSADQQLHEQSDGRVRVHSSVPNTKQLRGWLRSYGKLVEVVGPAELRQELAAEFVELAAKYDA